MSATSTHSSEHRPTARAVERPSDPAYTRFLAAIARVAVRASSSTNEKAASSENDAADEEGGDGHRIPLSS
jgi:hypothetical protein